jgi:hypothetical protein
MKRENGTTTVTEADGKLAGDDLLQWQCGDCGLPVHERLAMANNMEAQ